MTGAAASGQGKKDEFASESRVKSAPSAERQNKRDSPIIPIRAVFKSRHSDDQEIAGAALAQNVVGDGVHMVHGPQHRAAVLDDPYGHARAPRLFAFPVVLVLVREQTRRMGRAAATGGRLRNDAFLIPVDV